MERGNISSVHTNALSHIYLLACSHVLQLDFLHGTPCNCLKGSYVITPPLFHASLVQVTPEGAASSAHMLALPGIVANLAVVAAALP